MGFLSGKAGGSAVGNFIRKIIKPKPKQKSKPRLYTPAPNQSNASGGSSYSPPPSPSGSSRNSSRNSSRGHSGGSRNYTPAPNQTPISGEKSSVTPKQITPSQEMSKYSQPSRGNVREIVARNGGRVLVKSQMNTKENYNPRTNTFQRTSRNPQLDKGTIEVLNRRLPNKNEQIKINRQQSNILTVDSSKLNRDIKNIKNIKQTFPKLNRDISRKDERIKVLEKGKVQNGKFIGTKNEYLTLQKEYTERKSLVNQYNRNIKQIDETKNIKVGLVGEGRTRDIREFDYKNKPFSAGSSIIVSTIAETAGIGTEKVLNLMNVKSVPKHGWLKNDSMSTKEYGQKISRRIETVGNIGKYFIPVVGETIFAGEVGEYGVGIKRTLDSGNKLNREQKIEGAMLGGMVILGGALKGASAIKNARITKVEKQLSTLSEQPLRSLQIIERPSNKVSLTGFQTYNKLERRVDVVGALKKTESGFEFLPKAEGRAITTGKVKGLTKEKNILQVQLFDTGAKTASIPIKTSGELTLYKDFSLSTYKPKVSTFTLFGKSRKSISKAKKVLKENIILGGDTIKDISTSKTLAKGNNLLFTVGEKDIGVTLISESKVTKNIGRKYSTSTTPLSQTFGDIKQSQISKPVLDIKKIKKGLSDTTLKRPTISKSKSSFIENSAFAGTGLYERTDSLMSPMKINGASSLPLLNQNIKSENIISQTFIQPQKIIKSHSNSFKQPQVFSQEIKQNQKQLFKELTKQKSQQIPKQTFRDLLKDALNQQMKQRYKLKTTTKMKIIPRIKTQQSNIKIKDSNKGFKVFKKIKGIFEEVSTEETLFGASKSLKKGLKSDLSASGFVVDVVTGKRVKASQLGDFGQFRAGKKDPFLLVQKKSGISSRLGTRSEVRGIQSSKKSFSRTRKSKFNWM